MTSASKLVFAIPDIVGVVALTAIIVGIITYALTEDRCATVRAADIATMLKNDAQWRRDTVVAGCAVWATTEGGAVEWEWANGSIEHRN